MFFNESSLDISQRWYSCKKKNIFQTHVCYLCISNTFPKSWFFYEHSVVSCHGEYGHSERGLGVWLGVWCMYALRVKILCFSIYFRFLNFLILRLQPPGVFLFFIDYESLLHEYNISRTIPTSHQIHSVFHPDKYVQLKRS